MCGKVAVVTGSNMGIGLGIVKGLLQGLDGAVYLTSRDDERGRAAVDELHALGLNPEYHQLDVTDRNSIEAFRDHLKEKHGEIDLLVNNAAYDEPEDPSYEGCKRVIDTNYYSNFTIKEFIYPLVKSGGRILNISSVCGHLSNIRNTYWIERLSRKDLTVADINEFVQWYLESKKNGTFNPADMEDRGAQSHRIAKMALSALTTLQQKELVSQNVSVNSLHPGLVRAEVEGDEGSNSADDVARMPLQMELGTPAFLRLACVWYDHVEDHHFRFNTLGG